MRIGTIKQIWRFAVKSMGGEQLEACTVGMGGIPGDRGWAVRDETAGKLATGSRFPLLMQCTARYREPPVNGFIPHVDMRLPDGDQIGSDLVDVNARLTELLGKPVSLAQLPQAIAQEQVCDPIKFSARNLFRRRSDSCFNQCVARGNEAPRSGSGLGRASLPAKLLC